MRMAQSTQQLLKDAVQLPDQELRTDLMFRLALPASPARLEACLFGLLGLTGFFGLPNEKNQRDQTNEINQSHQSHPSR